jgi:hypothetical protein
MGNEFFVEPPRRCCRSNATPHLPQEPDSPLGRPAAGPEPVAAISHGQAHGHGHVVNPGGLFINLESMCDDYEQSIDSMIKTLVADEARREKSLEWLP